VRGGALVRARRVATPLPARGRPHVPSRAARGGISRSMARYVHKSRDAPLITGRPLAAPDPSQVLPLDKRSRSPSSTTSGSSQIYLRRRRRAVAGIPSAGRVPVDLTLADDLGYQFGDSRID
jgi:hypothetical protein